MNRKAKMVRATWMAGALLPLLAGIGGAANTKSALPQMVADGSPQTRSYNPNAVLTFHGTVLDVITGGAPGIPFEEMGLTVRADNGLEVHVDLGPRGFVESQGMFFRRGDSVTLTGAPAQVAGQYIFLAARIQTPYRVFLLRTPEGVPFWELNRQPYPNYYGRDYGRYAYPYRY